MYKQIGFIFSFGLAFLLIVSPFAMAETDTTEETAEAVEPEPKKSPIKVGGAMRVNYAYGAYGDEENPHPRGEKIGDVDLEIFRLNADLDYNNIIADRLQRDWIGIDISPKAAELVVERIRTDQGLFEDIVHRTDIPQRTDLGDIPRYNVRENKVLLYGEQAGNCDGCGEHFHMNNLEIDHIIATSVGGTDHINNLQLLCGHCNRVKGDRGQAYLLSKLSAEA